MNGFGELLLKARQRAGLTQQELGDNVDVTDSYISKMEKGVSRPPTREVALKLAEVLGLSEEAKQDFLLEANAAGKEDLKGFRLVKVADGQALESEQQAIPTPIQTLAHTAKPLPFFPVNTTGGRIDRLIAPARLTEEEEEEVAAALIELTKRFVKIISSFRKI